VSQSHLFAKHSLLTLLAIACVVRVLLPNLQPAQEDSCEPVSSLNSSSQHQCCGHSQPGREGSQAAQHLLRRWHDWICAGPA